MKTPQSVREIEETQLVEAINQIHEDDPQFGYRLICDELKDAGWKICERQGLAAMFEIWNRIKHWL